ncbi:thiopeptide-type bacteriocin biosynthesis protein [Saccharothrix obliqua]|uniref:thiopeptide-type bacteriocin biosynthesis protein n=1 Tax=Saccharothrix obliqua TaxID=2861747 RepID=UPI001C5FD143|nr:thiopeptide-type bacteriocin biosynthesis protein [Saccharothrix obliqua]MBW4717783.1 thiopeptide-type bacteriocin biosynthesis protein [Saccharothrix obliqua]
MTWHSLHARVSWSVEDVDTFIAHTLGPLMDDHRADGRIGDWFFVRYWSTGPHLRVRVRDASPETAEDLRRSLCDAIRDADFAVVEPDPDAYFAGLTAGADREWLPHGDVREVPYVPEVRRYGGEDAMAAAEEVFCRSTDVAVAVLRSVRSPAAKVSAAVELVMATASGLGMGRVAAAAWLRGMGAGWRQAAEPTTPPGLGTHFAARRLHAARGVELAARWDRLDDAPTGVVAHWMAQVDPEVPRWVWSSQLHMLLNRLGIGSEQERTLCWLTAAAAAAPAGVAPFHDDGPSAPDRRYLEASRFLPGVTEQFPRKDAVPAPAAPWWPTVDLPAPRPRPGTLTDALAGRFTARGAQLSGPLDAERLATLLWTAQGALPDDRRPYPSAGAQHSARLRVVAWRVDGLPPGVYDVDEDARNLALVAPAPSTSDMNTASMWFGSNENGMVDLDTTPALVAPYARVGSLRATYGLRALRLAMTEAGHLAQNLALVAQDNGLALGMVGGFYDDLAHDLLCLDGVDDLLVYLMPVASSTTWPSPPA